MTFDASDPRQVKAAERAAKAQVERKAQTIAMLVMTAQGREYIWNQLAEAHIFVSTYDDNPHRMAFHEGQRSRGLALLMDLLSAAPEAFPQMMREQNGRDTSTERSSGANGHGRDQGADDDSGDAPDDPVGDAFYDRG